MHFGWRTDGFVRGKQLVSATEPVKVRQVINEVEQDGLLVLRLD